MRRFLTTATIFFAPIILIALTTSTYFYNVVKPNQCGDLSMLGGFFVEGSRSYRSNLMEQKSPVKYAPKLFGEPDDATIINIGDSFSNLSPNYIDFIYSNHGVKIYDLPQSGQDPFDMAIALLESGYFERVETRILLLESVERTLYDRLVRVKNYQYNLPKTILRRLESGMTKEQFVGNEPPSTPSPRYSCEELINYINLLIKSNPVKSATLNRELFSIENQTLYFYEDDIAHCSLTDAELQFAEQQLNKMYDSFSQHGIKLIVLSVADKYNMYQDYIIDNPYPRSRVAEQISALDLNGAFITSGSAVGALIGSGKRDIYFVDDTHWSPIAGEAFGEVVVSSLQ